MKEKCVNCGKEIGFFGKLTGLKKEDGYLCDNCYGKIKEVKKLCSFNEKNISMDNLIALLNFYPNLQPVFDEKKAVWQKYDKYITYIDKMTSSLNADSEKIKKLHKENLNEFARSMDDFLEDSDDWHEFYGKTGDDALYYLSRMKKKAAAGNYNGLDGYSSMFKEKCRGNSDIREIADFAREDYLLLMEIKNDIDFRLSQIDTLLNGMKASKWVCELSANAEWVWSKHSKLKPIFDDLQKYITETKDDGDDSEHNSKVMILDEESQNVIILYTEVIGFIDDCSIKIPGSVFGDADNYKEELIHFTDFFSSELNTDFIEAFLADVKATYWSYAMGEIAKVFKELSYMEGNAVKINRLLKWKGENLSLAKVKILLNWNTILEKIENPDPIIAKEPLVINQFRQRAAEIENTFNENQRVYEGFLLKIKALKPQILSCFTFFDINKLVVQDKSSKDSDNTEVADVDLFGSGFGYDEDEVEDEVQIPIQNEDKDNELLPMDDLDKKEEIPVENPVIEERRGVICKECGRENVENAKFCRYCGANLLPEMFCTNCGKAIKPGKKFCSGCGAKVEY